MPKKKRQSEEEEKIDESWLLPYADMLTLLLALFIVLFAMSEVDAVKYKELAQVFKSEFSGGDSGILENDEVIIETPVEVPDSDKEDEEVSDNAEELANLKEIQHDIDNYTFESNLSEVIGTTLTDEGLLITILNDISFDSGSAVVLKEGQELAQEVSNFLDTEPPHQIVISGHADDRPMHNVEFGSNWELSVIRAVNFMGLLLENENLDAERFSAKGYGEHRPVVPNTSEENRAKNRRVEVLILPNYEIYTDSSR